MKKDWLSAKQALSKYNISSQKNKCALELPTVEDILIPSIQTFKTTLDLFKNVSCFLQTNNTS